jgi:FkbM family methyltransferase
MQLKEMLRKILNPKVFYFLVDVKNSIVPNNSYTQAKIDYNSALKFYDLFISENDLVFDIGANYGSRVKIFLGLKANVVAVEPQSKCVKFLKSMYGSKAIILEKGVGAKLGEMDFYTSDNSALSSFSEEWINKVKESNRFENFNWQKPVKIPVTTLEALIAEYGQPSFIKIDVEGLEHDVLMGLNVKVDQLSFEYAVPENLPELTNCLMRLKVLGEYLVNFSKGESMNLHFEVWKSIDDFLQYISTSEFQETFAGDIYVKLNNKFK